MVIKSIKALGMNEVEKRFGGIELHVNGCFYFDLTFYPATLFKE